MNPEGKVQFAVYTDNESLYLRLSRALALWSETMCVVCRVRRGGETAEPSDSLAILDMGSGAIPRSIPEGCAVIAAASDDEQCLRAYGYHARARLAPDFDAASLDLALGQCFDAWSAGLTCLELPRSAYFPLCRLEYVEASGRRSILHGAEDALIVPIPFGKLVAALPSPPFLRCQRSYAVNLGAAEAVSSGQLVLRDGTRIPVSRAEADGVRRELNSRRERGLLP